MIKYLNVLLFGAMIAMNYLAVALPLNGKTTGQLSDSYPNLFVPAGITFSIWGIIYLLLGVYCVVQFTSGNHTVLARTGWLFALSCFLNAIWIVCWHYEKLPLSLSAMIALLITLIFINLHIAKLPFGILKASFGVYLGWICIATIANVTALLVHYNWQRFGISEVTWTLVMILTGALLASVTLFRLRNPFIGLSVIWAFAGIAIKRQNDNHTIVIFSVAALLVVSLLTILGFFRLNAVHAE